MHEKLSHYVQLNTIPVSNSPLAHFVAKKHYQAAWMPLCDLLLLIIYTVKYTFTAYIYWSWKRNTHWYAFIILAFGTHRAVHSKDGPSCFMYRLMPSPERAAASGEKRAGHVFGGPVRIRLRNSEAAPAYIATMLRAKTSQLAGDAVTMKKKILGREKSPTSSEGHGEGNGLKRSFWGWKKSCCG